jgi:hypothetical protein
MQISLRGYLAIAAAIVLGLDAVIGYRSQTMESVDWIEIASPHADKLFSIESIVLITVPK